ncbi:hypothetical protein KTC96_23615 (plasmid) [Clostridium estertheticum]|uniref:hypothetical protein n=1 Tax=Clostridium estertheticum TaxID=238834 RepID=UPI001C7D68BC|nr:hypothetical protein [Clostridium estertheticum]MBX4262248.1 hypothetical protein [Clostridium estertheticum]WLC72880.1 hypothetical protein KTC96_23615 [Clostridium estertheticum]
MIIIYPPELRDLTHYKKSIKSYSNDEYRVAFMPQFSEYKGLGLGKASDIMSLTSNSATKDLAWNFLAFANGKEYAIHYCLYLHIFKRNSS